MKFKVAGHVFQIKGVRSYNSVAERIQLSYGPFALEDDVPDSKLMFTLELGA